MQYLNPTAQVDGLTCATKNTVPPQIEIKDSIQEIEKHVWNRLCQKGQFCSHEYLCALEASNLDCKYLYALAFLDGELVGAAFATTWRITMMQRLSLCVTTMGTPVNTGLALLVKPHANETTLRHELIVALEQASAKQRVRLFVGRDFPAQDYVETLSLTRLYDCAYLNLRWGNFDQYLDQHPKRKSIRRDIRSLEKAGYRLEIREGRVLSDEEAQRLHELWLQLYRKHQSPDQIMVNRNFFLQLSRLGHTVWLLLRRENRIDAFDLCFVLDGQLESTYCGVDIQTTGRLPVHRVMGYHIIRHAIAKGLKSINFGISNEQSKVEMGCHLKPYYAWLEANPKWLGYLLRPLLHRFVLKPGNPQSLVSEQTCPQEKFT